MFKDKHLTAKDMFDDFRAYFVTFLIINIMGLGLMVYDAVFTATFFFVVGGIFGIFLLLILISYHSRLSRETMAKMLGKDFMEFCVCKFCEKQRKI